jgi:hypothetical protein
MPHRNHVKNVPLQMTGGHPLPLSQLQRASSRRVTSQNVNTDHRHHAGTSAPQPSSFNQARHLTDFERFMQDANGHVGLSGLPPVPDVFVSTGLSGLPVRIDLATRIDTGLSGLPEEVTRNLVPTGVPPSHDPALDRFDLTDLHDALPGGAQSGRGWVPQQPQQSPSGTFGPLSSHPVTATPDKATYGLSGFGPGEVWDNKGFGHRPVMHPSAQQRQSTEINSFDFGSSQQLAEQDLSFEYSPLEVKQFHATQKPRQIYVQKTKKNHVGGKRVPVRISSANQAQAHQSRRKPLETPASEITEITGGLFDRVEGWLDRVKPSKEPEDSDRWMHRVREETQVLWSNEAKQSERPDFPIYEESSHRGTKRSAVSLSMIRCLLDNTRLITS